MVFGTVWTRRKIYAKYCHRATFTLNGFVNSRNIREYAPKGQLLDFHYDQNPSRERANVWAALCGNGRILGPYFFDVNVNWQCILICWMNRLFRKWWNIFHYNIVGDEMFPGIWRIIVQQRLCKLFGDRVGCTEQQNGMASSFTWTWRLVIFSVGYIKCRVFTVHHAVSWICVQEFYTSLRCFKTIKILWLASSEVFACESSINGGHIKGNFA